MNADADFGSFLANVQERDVDLLLMEEFHVSRHFVDWFCGHAGHHDVKFDGAWHSVTDADGETDLLLRVTSGSRRIGFLIENKIAAPEMPSQSERYHLRAARAQQAGYFEQFVTCMCAPRAYLEGLSDQSLYQVRIAYEDISDWFVRSDDLRSNWRRAVMDEAIAQGRRGYKMIVNEAVSRFHLEFWQHLHSNYPKLTMRRPSPKGNKSNWLLFKGHGFPKGVGFHIKIDQCVVELGFNGRSISDLLPVIGGLPAGIQPIQKGGTAASSIAIPALDQTKPLQEQDSALLETMKAVERLFPYSTAFVQGVNMPDPATPSV